MAAGKAKDPAKPNAPLSVWERAVGTVVGLAALSFGTYATLKSTNGLGTISLIVLGGVFLVVGALGLVPSWVQIGQIQAKVVHNLTAKVEDAATPPAERQAAAGLLAQLNTGPRVMFGLQSRVPRYDYGLRLYTCPVPGCGEAKLVGPGEPTPECHEHQVPMTQVPDRP
jgi:hypothetical protein